MNMLDNIDLVLGWIIILGAFVAMARFFIRKIKAPRTEK